MRKKIYRVETLIMSGVLGLLGFSCSDINGETPDMYGTPITDYVVKGTVTDENQKPIKGIQVINSYDFTYAPNVIKDTTYKFGISTENSKSILKAPSLKFSLS